MCVTGHPVGTIIAVLCCCQLVLPSNSCSPRTQSSKRPICIFVYLTFTIKKKREMKVTQLVTEVCESLKSVMDEEGRAGSW